MEYRDFKSVEFASSAFEKLKSPVNCKLLTVKQKATNSLLGKVLNKPGRDQKPLPLGRGNSLEIMRIWL